VLITDDGAGSPEGISFIGGVLQAGSPNVLLTSPNGDDFKFIGVVIKNAQVDNVDVTGSAVTSVLFDGCTFRGANQSGSATAYDVNLAGMATGRAYFRNCVFLSPVGSGAGFVTNPFNDPNHVAVIEQCAFLGTGTTPGNVFPAGNTPYLIRSCPGFNPRGAIFTPVIPTTSPYTAPASQEDISVYFSAPGVGVGIEIGGTPLNAAAVAAALAGGQIDLPARQTITLTGYGLGNEPSWQWFGN
jgi:hypothetical protein